MQNNSKKEVFIVQAESSGLRIDNFLSEKIPGKSRSHLQKLIGNSLVRVNEASVSKNHKLSSGDIVEFTYMDSLEQGFSGIIKPQKIPLNILYEDDYYLIISKDAGISVHPSPGRYENTLVNALLFHFKDYSKNFPGTIDGMDGINIIDSTDSMDNLDSIYDTGMDDTKAIGSIGSIINGMDSSTDDVDKGHNSSKSNVISDRINSSSAHLTDGKHSMDNMRPGIIHRLDKDTSGLIIVAKDGNAQYRMAELFKNRQVEKTYLVLVAGGFNEKKGKIDLPIGRSRLDRKKMAVSIDSGRSAVTEFEIKESFEECTLLNAFPKTGRTHQIRVHFSYIDHPIIGDGTYGNSESAGIGNTLGLNRQFLHAQKLSFYHPFTNKRVEIEDEPALDLQKSLKILKTAQNIIIPPIEFH